MTEFRDADELRAAKGTHLGYSDWVEITPRGGCIISGSEDCKKSLTCKEKGNCRFRSGVCAK